MIDSITGYATLTGPGKLSVVFPSIPVPVDGRYWILKTDYANFSVVYSCVDLLLAHAGKQIRNPIEHPKSNSFTFRKRVDINERTSSSKRVYRYVVRGSKPEQHLDEVLAKS